jgi:hypothetical protein
MHIVRSGKTRVVILIGPYALKVARFGLSYTLRRTIEILLAGQTREKIVGWRRDKNLSVLDVLCKTLFIGVVSNMKEYHLWRRHADFSLMPTLSTFFYLVNVQRRGNPIADETRLNHPLLRLLPGPEHFRSDIDRPEQYCWHGGQLLLVDYAHLNLEGLLEHQSKPAS